MDKGLAYLVFPFYYLMAPMICWQTGESMEEVIERIWLYLNGYYEDRE